MKNVVINSVLLILLSFTFISVCNAADSSSDSRSDIFIHCTKEKPNGLLEIFANCKAKEGLENAGFNCNDPGSLCAVGGGPASCPCDFQAAFDFGHNLGKTFFVQSTDPGGASCVLTDPQPTLPSGSTEAISLRARSVNEPIQGTSCSIFTNLPGLPLVDFEDLTVADAEACVAFITNPANCN